MSFQNLRFSNHLKHISHHGVENNVGSKRKITESKSEARELTTIKMIGNNNIPAKKTRSLKLSLYEEKHINSNNMLSNKSINLAQQLLVKQFPDSAGFGDVALTEQYGFDVINTVKSFIQILLIGSAHWISVANIKQNRSHNRGVAKNSELEGVVAGSNRDLFCIVSRNVA